MRIKDIIQSIRPESKTRAAEHLIKAFKPTSGVTFTSSEGRTMIESHVKVDLTEDEAFNYAVKINELEEVVGNLSPEQRLQAIAQGRYFKSKENIGGFGITERSLEDLDDEIPNISAELLNEKGKIVMLGNGLSTAIVEILEKSDPNNFPELFVVDVFDYEALHMDLLRLKKIFDEKKVKFPADLQNYLNKSTLLIEHIRADRIKAVQYVFGSGNPPEELFEADLVVNSHGPPDSTLAEQIQCLKINGRLFINSYNLPYQTNAESVNLLANGRAVASEVRRFA